MKNKNDFEFKYVAPTSEERKEIESIRNSYLAKSDTNSKLERLRKLDFKIKQIPVIVSLIVGIVGALIFGLGLTMILEWNLIVWGIMVSIVAMFPIAVAYPTYTHISIKLKNKHSNEILKLSEELLKED